MKKILSFVLMCSLAWTAQQSYAQTNQQQTPKSWAIKTAVRPVHTVRLPSFDLDARLQDDAQRDALKNQPWRFGYEHQINEDLRAGTIAEMLPNGGMVWRKRFSSRQALSMNLTFSDFHLAEGATIHAYNDDRSQVIGAYTSKNNNPAHELGSSPIKDDHIIVELYEPAGTIGQSRAIIGQVIHGYRDIFAYASRTYKDLNDAGKCNYDVNCPLGNGWQNQINSVAIIIVGGSGACTGSLVNNTANDGTPYFLTANHCLGGSVANWVFRFNWESPTPICGTSGNSTLPPQPYNEINGATQLANSAGSDFALLRLNATPTGDVYYNGWDRSGVVSPNATGIHHPSGDVKKISRENNALVSSTWQNAQVWQVPNWDMGTTEGGSSGSPLFDNNQRVIGQLYGGGAACNQLVNNGQPDYYGKLSTSWTGGGANNNRLSNWLDPAGTAPNFIDGYNPNTPTNGNDAGARSVSGINSSYCNNSSISPIVTIRNFGANVLSSAVINYGLVGGTNMSFNFSGSLASNSSTTVALPSLNGNAGANTFYAFTSMPNAVTDSNAVNDTTRFNFFVVANGLNPQLYIVDNCYGSETSWNITDANGTILGEGSGYTDDNSPSAIIESLCLPLGCYNFNLWDSYGDGLRGNYGFQCAVDGDAFILSPSGDTLCNLSATNGNFGTSVTLPFCLTAPTSPTAAFSSNRQTICENGNVSFTNASTSATSYAWTFAGGTPATSTAANPVVSYAAAGSYGVTLVATNSIGSNTITQSSYINVATNSVSVINTVNGQNVTCAVSGGTAPYTYRWSNGAMSQNLSNVPAGTYTVTVTDANGCQQSQTATVIVGVENLSNIEEVNLFPNPTNDQATLAIRLNRAEAVSVLIYSATGQLVSSQHYDSVLNLAHSIDLSDKAAGLYMVQLRVGNQSKSYKLHKK